MLDLSIVIALRYALLGSIFYQLSLAAVPQHTISTTRTSGCGVTTDLLLNVDELSFCKKEREQVVDQKSRRLQGCDGCFVRAKVICRICDALLRTKRTIVAYLSQGGSSLAIE
jgi:hypothetical protein